MIMGIDPGLDGGLAGVTLDGELRFAKPMPTLRYGEKGPRHVSGVLLRPFVLADDIDSVALERVWARGRQGNQRGEGAANSFRFGDSFGAVRCAFQVHHTVTLWLPKVWQATFGLSGGEEGKTAARELASELWPEHAPLFLKNKKRGSGLADAALIAEHQRRRNQT